MIKQTKTFHPYGSISINIVLNGHDNNFHPQADRWRKGASKRVAEAEEDMAALLDAKFI